jgi:restriction system protein
MSKSQDLAVKLIYGAFTILKQNGNQLPGREVVKKIPELVELDDWAKKQYEKTGYIRWQSLLHFFTIDSIKAGYMLKKSGVWILTPEGEEAYKLGAQGLFDKQHEAYRVWAEKTGKHQPSKEAEDEPTADDNTSYASLSVELETIEQKALDNIKQFIDKKNPYEFQDIVAALLKTMGYHIPFVAPRGKDGGLDIIAYQDPLGTKSPRIKVQIKHRESSASVQEVRQLLGLLSKDGDVGLFVSTGGFTSDSLALARNSHIHVELIDYDRFIELWKEFYTKMSDEDKDRVPLKTVYLLAPQD